MINHHIEWFRYDIHDTTLKIPGTHQGFSHTMATLSKTPKLQVTFYAYN